MLKTVCFYILFFLAICLKLTAVPVITRHLGINNGLSNNSVRCIFQDHNGYMWFGTYDGLNRYNGYSFKTFRNSATDASSLPHNYINAIGEDGQHNIVVGTGQGVSIYNSLTQTFSTGRFLPIGSRSPVRIPYNVTSIRTDTTGNLYMTTNGGGLLVKSPESDIAVQIPCEPDKRGNCSYNLYNLVIDHQQRVWLIAEGIGVYQYMPATKRLKLVDDQVSSITAMESDNAGNLWVGNAEGLVYKFNIATRQTSIAYRQVNSKPIFSLAFDKLSNTIWIGTEGGGASMLNASSGKSENLLPGEGKNALSSETIYVIYNDRENRKWIGTHKGGIDIIDPLLNPFQTVSHDPVNSNSLTGNFVASVYEDENRNLWIGTDGKGLSIWNRKENRFTNYQYEKENPNSLSNNSIPSIVEDHLQKVWIATFGGGINRFDKTTGQFKHYKCINPQNGRENNYVWKLLEDRQHNLWATTYADGRLYRLNRETDQFEIFSEEFVDFFCLFEDNSGTLWAGSAYGLCRIDREKKRFQYYEISKPVRSIYADNRGNLWLGTEGAGLILFDKTKNKIAAGYTTAEGLCNNAVLNILEDRKGNLWLSTFNGLSRFNVNTKSFKNYSAEDGLQSDQFEYNAALRLHSGELVFGGINGLNIFNPESFPVRNYFPPVLLTDLRINDQDVAEGSPYLSERGSGRITRVSIPYDEAVLSIEFATLEYSSPGKIDYAYYLQGWDKSWNYSGKIRTANYTKLADGNYTLRIKATNAEGKWNPQEIAIKIVVLPPWYRSWWAYLLYAAAILAMIYLYNGYRIRRSKLKYEMRLAQMQAGKDRELAQLEIQTQKELAAKEKELAEKKLMFFTDVSHEFRTPLTLIINPLKDYLATDQPADKISLNGVYRNARRLLALVDQLLLFRKAGENADSMRIVKLNFAKLCREVFSSFEGAIKNKELSFHFEGENDAFELYADRQKMEAILFNLLSNAVKFTPAGGRIELRLTEKDDSAILTIADNGQGIPAEVGNRLFERFYRVESNGVATKPGFGIGLYLVKHFVECHKGEIVYENLREGGTVFSLSFRKGFAHFPGISIHQDEQEIDVENPLLPDEPEKPAEEEISVAGLEDLISDRKSILIVEDNQQIRDYVCSVFSKDYLVYQADGGMPGLDSAKKYLPDLIISDIMMENGNGIDLCGSIKEDPALGHIPVILLTAVCDNDIRLKGTERGADDYITKPFDKDLLVARVETLLKNRTRLQEYFFNEVTLKKNDLKISAEYKEFLVNCIAIVEKHLDDDAFNIKKMLQEIGMSHSALYRKVKSMSGQSIAGFIRYIRLRKAAELMIRSSRNVNEIAYMVGINDTKYFRKQFNAQFGLNPSDYIKKYRASAVSGKIIEKQP